MLLLVLTCCAVCVWRAVLFAGRQQRGRRCAGARTQQDQDDPGGLQAGFGACTGCLGAWQCEWQLCCTPGWQCIHRNSQGCTCFDAASAGEAVVGSGHACVLLTVLCLPSYLTVHATIVRCATLQFATEAALTILRIDDLIKLDAPPEEGGEE